MTQRISGKQKEDGKGCIYVCTPRYPLSKLMMQWNMGFREYLNIHKGNRRVFFESSYSTGLIIFWNYLILVLCFSWRRWLINTNSCLLPLTLKAMLTWVLALFPASKETLFSGIKSIPAHLFLYKDFVSFILSCTKVGLFCPEIAGFVHPLVNCFSYVSARITGCG